MKVASVPMPRGLALGKRAQPTAGAMLSWTPFPQNERCTTSGPFELLSFKVTQSPGKTHAVAQFTVAVSSSAAVCAWIVIDEGGVQPGAFTRRVQVKAPPLITCIARVSAVGPV